MPRVQGPRPRGQATQLKVTERVTTKHRFADWLATRRQAAQQKAAVRQAVKQRVAERQAAEQRAAQQKAAERQGVKQRTTVRQGVKQRTTVRQGVKQRTTVREGGQQKALSLSMSRKLVEASNTATAVLEADAANSKLAHGKPSAYELPFFQEQAQLEGEQDLARRLTEAARGLVDAFTELLNATFVWDRLADSERTLGQALAKVPHPFRVQMELAELLEHHIPEMLLTLGYHPPPPAETWADQVQNSVRSMLSVNQDEVAFARNTARAQQELLFFTRRLRALVEAAEESPGQDRQDDGSRFEAFLVSLRAAVSAARNRAIPAALGAGAGAAVPGVIVGGPSAMGIAVLSGSAASLLGAAALAGATALLAKGPQGDTPLMSAAQVIRIDIEALDECVELRRSATSTNIERIHFIIRRGVFQILQDAEFCSAPVQKRLWEWSEVLLSQLDEVPTDESHQIVDRARKLFAEAR